MSTLYPRHSLAIDEDGDVWLVTDPGPHGDLESRLLGHVTTCRFRVPDHLEGEYGAILDGYGDGLEARRAYEREGEHLWNRR